MKLQCIAFKNARFNTLVVTLGAGKSLKFDKIGQEAEVDDELGYEIMARHKGMLKQVQETPKKTRGLPKDPPTVAPENKMASSNRHK